MTLAQLAKQNEEFYQIDKPMILTATTPAYREFLREAGYGDLDNCSRIEFAKGVLRIDPAVRDAAARVNLNLQGNDGDYVVNITHPNARRLVEAMGYKVPTVGLMYGLFIPWIKNLIYFEGNAEMRATLREMKCKKAEWLEDLILDRTRLKIGTQERRLSFLDEGGGFDRGDINEFGYPSAVKGVPVGSYPWEFFYWRPKDNEISALRGGSPELHLILFGKPSVEADWIGIRPIKFFHKK